MTNFFSYLSFANILDWTIIGLIMFRLITMIRGTRAMSVCIGLIILGFMYVLSSILKLQLTHYALSYFFDHLILIVALLFQEEIRRALAEVGRKASVFAPTRKEASVKEISDAVSRVAANMAHEHIGGLIVIERQDKLQNILDSGSHLFAKVKVELMYSIFLPNSPLHDGAIVISKGEIAAAGCILPLCNDAGLNKKFGTRHRAAIGLTQETDAVVVLISEEAGQAHLVVDGKVTLNLNEKELKEALMVLQEKDSVGESWTDKVKNKIRQFRSKNT